MSRRRLFLVSKVESCGQIVNFTINGDPVQGETCTTWEEWANSEYNTIGANAYCDDGVCYLFYEGMTDNGNSWARYPNGPEEGATLRADEPI